LPGVLFPVPESVRTYLGLTEAQAARITALNAQYGAFARTKQLRRLQVEQEIVLEREKPVLDAMALGLRYVELEVMRREVAGERKKTVAAVRALLTEAQRAKVAVLEQALRDYDTACAAAGWNLLEAPLTWVGATKVDRFSRELGSVCGGGVGAWLEAGEFRL
jgi:hypothetical protein